MFSSHIRKRLITLIDLFVIMTEQQSLDLGLRMEPLIRCQRSQPEANNSVRASTVMQLSSTDPIEMKDQTPWSVFKINNSVDKVKFSK